MKQKLKKIQVYANSLLPHETTYLLQEQKMEDEEKLSILKIIAYNSNNFTHPKAFDFSIDKRKYSHLLSWMRRKLDSIDVDKQLEWILDAKKHVLLDSISQEEEKRLLNSLKKFDSTSFYFVEFYNLLLHFRHFLLIRMRYDDYQIVNTYIEKEKFNYEKSKLVYEKMHQISFDIIGASNLEEGEGLSWLKWLHECYEDEKLDGQNRYMALIRISFVSLKYDRLNELKDIFLRAELFFETGKNYSKRLLLNHYGNMLILFDKLGDREKAIHYGYLSIKELELNPDSVIYLNNLNNVLIKNQKYEEALSLIEKSSFKVKSNKNFHATIGFVSNHIRCLSKTGKVKEAIIKGRLFFNVYHKKILSFRWHRFFSAFLGALLIEERHAEIIQYIEKYKLLTLRNKETYLGKSSNIIDIYYIISRHQEGIINQDQFNENLKDMILDSAVQKEKLDKELIEYIDKMKKHMK
ncbi:hypothetical protein [Portibacter lacus]|uniref:Tetratricopeptide repeat protein n=1 Tax=Portibacter lacus TaxID=1099794 RepID=A0AA37WHU7_9BACT|nr:hypothetical protein [Portibacter lacus]GLR20009.1 hypothetical protein GCM10007940_46250 [Portibacter lacus]